MSQDLQLFTTILLELEAHGEARSRKSLESLVAERLHAGPAASDLQALLFARALSRRLSPEPLDALNAWLRARESPRHLEPLPHVTLAGHVANTLLCQHMAGLQDVVLLDIGPGAGAQSVELLRQLGQRGAGPRRLTVVAVEPDAVGLRATEHNLVEASHAYGIPTDVLGFHALVEELDPVFWAVLASLPGTLLVHAAFALNHVHGPGQREALLRRLRMLEPRALVLVEPSSDHASEDLESRFRNCWHYFHRLFELVDRLELPRPERDALKLSLGRDIEDILRGPEERRATRHESVSGWWRRLERAGFKRSELPVPSVPAHPWVRPQRYPGYTGLDFAGETLVAVLCATPATPPW
jgi:hypothetical protein